MLTSLQNLLQKPKNIAVGLMSGTSLDGIDAALVEIEGKGLDIGINLLHFISLAFSDQEREQLLQLCYPTTGRVNDICEWNVKLGHRFAEAANTVIKEAGLLNRDVDFISSHGQTIYHIPEQKATLQIGELAVIAQDTGCLTVGDFRPNDMAAGGQGAPLVPFLDYVLFKHQKIGRVLLNIGGISNMTVLNPGAGLEDVIAFDTGPGNMLIDAIVKIGSNHMFTYDAEGQIAARGHIDQVWLDEILQQDIFLTLAPPKSTGREYYTMERAQAIWKEGERRGLSFEDIVATITSYTSSSIIAHFEQFIEPKFDIDEVLVSGGGVHNKTLMAALNSSLKQKVAPIDEWNIPGDAKEAMAFALLGHAFLHGDPNNIPSATGASKPLSMGKLTLP